MSLSGICQIRANNNLLWLHIFNSLSFDQKSETGYRGQRVRCDRAEQRGKRLCLYHHYLFTLVPSPSSVIKRLQGLSVLQLIGYTVYSEFH